MQSTSKLHLSSEDDTPLKKCEYRDAVDSIDCPRTVSSQCTGRPMCDHHLAILRRRKYPGRDPVPRSSSSRQGPYQSELPPVANAQAARQSARRAQEAAEARDRAADRLKLARAEYDAAAVIAAACEMEARRDADRLDAHLEEIHARMRESRHNRAESDLWRDPSYSWHR